jgi:hypothetical protein
MVSIVYCILANKEPQRIARLVNRIQTGQDRVYIHFDSARARTFRDWKSVIERKCANRNIEIVSEFRCKWGSFGIVDATLSAMRHYEDFNYDYFINLSGECYPLKPPEVIKEELNGQNCALMEVFKMPYSGFGRHGGMNRIQNRYYPMPLPIFPYPRGMSIPRLKKRLPCDLEPYGGSTWFCLPKQLVSYILEFVKQNPAVPAFFRHVFAPDEMFFQTILLNSPFRSKIVNDNRRYIDWSRSRPPTILTTLQTILLNSPFRSKIVNDNRRYIDWSRSRLPKILTKDDLDNIKKSGKLFARKFDLNVDKNILDIIDREISNQARAAVGNRARAPREDAGSDSNV